jgi:transcriptional regulator with XRE-family HTH domain
MKIRYAFAKALRYSRKAKGLTQEDFSVVSSRTYLSALERSQKSPTLDKIHALAQTIGVHVLSLLTLTYLYFDNDQEIDPLLARIKTEVDSIQKELY